MADVLIYWRDFAANWIYQQAGGLTHEPTRGQVVDLLLLDRRVELPVEVLQGLHIPEGGGLLGSTR